MFRRCTIAALSLAFPAIVLAQGALSRTVIYPEKLHSDVEVFRDFVHKAHPDPYRYITRQDLDRQFDAVRDSIRVPISTNEFLGILLPVFHRIGDANLVPELDKATEALLRFNVPVLPVMVRVLEDGIFVDEELKGFRSLPPGSRILSIDRRPWALILDDLGRMVVTDGDNESLRWKLLERDFPWLYYRKYGESTSFLVSVEIPDGMVEERTIFSMTGNEIARTRKPATTSMYPWRSVWEPESSTLWVSLSTLDHDSIMASGQNTKKFLTGVQKELKKNKARTMVIDVRGAGGRELGMAERIFAMMAKAPFRVVQGMTVRNAPTPDGYSIQQMQPEHFAAVSASYLPDANGTASLRPDDHRLELVDPAPKAFEGKVYMVCDGGTRDAAAALVMLASRHGRARIVGEETGSNAYSFTGGRELAIVAPNSGLQLRIPLVRYLPDGRPAGPVDHGEIPKHVVQQRPWGIAKGKDTVRGALLEMIKELQ